jgi:hypothetical protein
MIEGKKPQKKTIAYIDILKQAGQIVWENNFLLWFGFLMALGSPGSFNIERNSENFGVREETVQKMIESHWQIILALAGSMIVIGIVFFLVSLVAKAGLIRSVYAISHQRKTCFSEGWYSGKKYFGKLFRLSVVFFLAIFLTLIILSVPVIYLFAAKSWISATLVGLLAVAIFLPLLFIFSITKTFAEFYVILSNLSLWSAIESGYEILLKNMLHSIIFSLLILAVAIVSGIILVPIIAIALLILVPSGFIFFSLGKIAFGLFLTIAVLLFLIVILFISSIFRTFETTAWTLFFWEIAKVEKAESEAIIEEAKKAITATPASPAN